MKVNKEPPAGMMMEGWISIKESELAALRALRGKETPHD